MSQSSSTVIIGHDLQKIGIYYLQAENSTGKFEVQNLSHELKQIFKLRVNPFLVNVIFSGGLKCKHWSEMG